MNRTEREIFEDSIFVSFFFFFPLKREREREREREKWKCLYICETERKRVHRSPVIGEVAVTKYLTVYFIRGLLVAGESVWVGL